MARLSNEEIRRMSLDEADAYTDAHPAEVGDLLKRTTGPQTRKPEKP